METPPRVKKTRWACVHVYVHWVCVTSCLTFVLPYLSRPAEVENRLLAHQASEYQNPLARRQFHLPEISFLKCYEKHFFCAKNCSRAAFQWARVEKKERKKSNRDSEPRPRFHARTLRRRRHNALIHLFHGRKVSKNSKKSSSQKAKNDESPDGLLVFGLEVEAFPPASGDRVSVCMSKPCLSALRKTPITKLSGL